MVLRNWQTNSVKLREAWRRAGIETQEYKTIDAGCDAPNKVLGLAWDPDKDIIIFDFSKLINIFTNGSSTKRFILQILGCILDPIGLFGPFIIRLKILLHELRAVEIDWDDKLSFSLNCKGQLWCSELIHLNSVEIPRYYFSDFNLYDFISFDIHSYSDASVEACGCVIFLRENTHDNRVIVKFVCSKRKENPADILYRGILASDLAKNSLWWYGLLWLSKPSEFWPDIFSNEPSTKENVSRRLLYQTKLVLQIWAKWKNNYLIQLRNARNFVNPNPEKNLKLGDVVLIEGTTKSKYLWPLGIIEDFIIGRDGHIRSCLVRSAKGQYKRQFNLFIHLK
ncbi:integrase catalytic domain-containing protein [Nephila pilipes]|uniref:Integrase catalytic domain-containing protein n=1 Tax=Nephila pilipes TaxID=299642 RepID=A0A8X6MMD2_NEPPI|nr:integrase catalytic domain-containing protein [Nephila pilipes]